MADKIFNPEDEFDKGADEAEYDRYATKEWIEEEERKGLKFKRTAILVPYRGQLVYMFNAASHAKASMAAAAKESEGKDGGSTDRE